MTIPSAAMRLLIAGALAGPAVIALAPPRALAAEVSENKMFTLDKVTFEGNKLVSTETLMAVAGLLHGQKVNIPMVKDAFQRVVDEYTKDKVNGTITPTVSARGNLMTVAFKITGEAPVVTTTVHRKPILDHETFTGNVKVATDKLTPAMTIKPGSEVTSEMIGADLNTLGAAYKAAGVGASIAPKVTQLPEGHVDLNFEIKEGHPKEQ